MGSRSGRRSARRVASAVDVDRISGGSWALEVAGVLRVASAVVADQIRVGSWAHEEAKSRRGEAERDGEVERSRTAPTVRSGRRRAHLTAKRRRTAPKGVEHAGREERDGVGEWSSSMKTMRTAPTVRSGKSRRTMGSRSVGMSICGRGRVCVAVLSRVVAVASVWGVSLWCQRGVRASRRSLHGRRYESCVEAGKGCRCCRCRLRDKCQAGAKSDWSRARSGERLGAGLGCG